MYNKYFHLVNINQIKIKTTPMRFELMRAMPNGLAIHPLNHSGTVSKKTVIAGFEPARAMPNRFQVCLLNHSDISPYM